MAGFMGQSRDKHLNPGMNEKVKGHTLSVLSHGNTQFIIQTDSLKDLEFLRHLKSH